MEGSALKRRSIWLKRHLIRRRRECHSGEKALNIRVAGHYGHIELAQKSGFFHFIWHMGEGAIYYYTSKS
jgi:hypothetical protein